MYVEQGLERCTEWQGTSFENWRPQGHASSTLALSADREATKASSPRGRARCAPAEWRSREANTAQNTEIVNWRYCLDEIRTFFEQEFLP